MNKNRINCQLSSDKNRNYDVLSVIIGTKKNIQANRVRKLLPATFENGGD